MPGPNKRWEEEEEESSSSAPDSPPVGAVRRGKFDDEEAEDSDVLESWDAAEDSEVEREKAKKAAEAKAKAEAEAAANKKSKSQRIAERQAERAAALAAEEDESSDEESEAQKRERMRAMEKEADLRNAEDLFADIGIKSRKTTTGANVVIDAKDPNNTIDLSTLPIFNPNTKTQFENLNGVLIPIVSKNSKKAHYSLFLQELTKQLAKDLPSDQIKKISSALTALSNEKLKEEKAADKTGKKSKAQKTKTVLAGVSRGAVADVNAYDDTFGDDDFM